MYKDSILGGKHVLRSTSNESYIIYAVVRTSIVSVSYTQYFSIIFMILSYIAYTPSTTSRVRGSHSIRREDERITGIDILF